jgi:transcriptional regulator with XRE-family HTH domain
VRLGEEENEVKEIDGVLLRKSTLNQAVLDKVNDALAERKITYRAIARKMKTSESAISRALSGKYALSLRNLERICEAAGLKVEFTVTADVPPRDGDTAP